jgi:hypothetical protein
MITDENSIRLTDGMDRLATIEHALARKKAAQKALTQRLSRKGAGRGAALPTSDASRLAILDAEVESLERSRAEEALALAHPTRRTERREYGMRSRPHDISDPVAKAETAGIGRPPAGPAPTPQPLLSASTSSRGHDDPADAAWRSYRKSQRMRDFEVRESRRHAWREREAELKKLRANGQSRVDARLGMPSPRGRSDGSASPALVGALVPTDLAERVAAGRRDARVLSAELRHQRSREWKVHGEHLRQIRANTTKRVDDKVAPDVLLSRPMHSLMSSASSPSLWESTPESARLLHPPASKSNGLSRDGGKGEDAASLASEERALLAQVDMVEATGMPPGSSSYRRVDESAAMRSARAAQAAAAAARAAAAASPVAPLLPHQGYSPRFSALNRAPVEGQALTIEQLRKQVAPWK